MPSTSDEKSITRKSVKTFIILSNTGDIYNLSNDISYNMGFHILNMLFTTSLTTIFHFVSLRKNFKFVSLRKNFKRCPFHLLYFLFNFSPQV